MPWAPAVLTSDKEATQSMTLRALTDVARPAGATSPSLGSALPGTRDTAAYSERIIASLRHPFLVLDRELKVVTASISFYRMFQVSNAETEGRPLFALGNGQWDLPELRHELERLRVDDRPIHDFPIDRSFPH